MREQRDSWRTATAEAAPKARARAEADSDAAFSDDDDMGDVRADDTKAYQEKVGRYRSRVSSVLKGADRELWLLAQVNTQARKPWDNFFCWMQKCKGERQGTDPGVVAQLVLGQTGRFSELFENLLGPQAWADFLDGCPLRQVEKWNTIAFEMVLHNASWFWWRVRHRLDQYPWRLFTLLDINLRAREASVLLDAQDLSESMRKVRALFSQELGVVASMPAIGMMPLLPAALQNFLQLLAAAMPGDVQEIESVNFLCTRTTKAAPHISMPLLNARVATSKRLGLGTADAPQKWSDLESKVTDILTEATQSFSLGVPLANAQDRYETPPPLPKIPVPQKPQTPAALCGSRWNLEWYRALKRPCSSGQVFTLQPRDFKQTSLREAWVCPSTHGYTGLLCRCDVLQAEQVRGRFRLQLALPLQFKDSLSLFNEAYDDVARREAAGDVALAVFFFAAAWTQRWHVGRARPAGSGSGACVRSHHRGRRPGGLGASVRRGECAALSGDGGGLRVLTTCSRSWKACRCCN